MAKKRNLPSLNEIAREINISASTISRVLNGKPGIAEATRQTVLSALHERGYPKKPIQGGVQTLRNGSSTIAFAITSKIRERIANGDPFYGRHLLALQTACAQKGYYPILVDYEQDTTPDGGLRCVDEHRVYGVVAEDMPEPMIEKLRSRIGIVLLNIVRPIPQVDYVIPDVRQAAREQVQFLYDLGHRSIACFRPLPVGFGGWQTHFYWSEFWWMHKKLQLDLPDEFFAPIQFSAHGEEVAAEEFMERVMSSSSPPTAIVTSDNYAGIIMNQCKKRKLRIPKDISLMGYDDRRYLSGAANLSTYRQNFEGMAREALRLLVDRCENLNLSGRIVEIEGTLIHRDTVAPPPHC